MLVYSVYNSEDNTWSAPVSVDDDETGDYYPELKTDGKNIYITWLNETVKGYVPTEASIEDLKNLTGEIRFSAFDNSTNKFAESVAVTEESSQNTVPCLGFADGKIVIAYSYNSLSSVTGTKGINAIKYRSSTDGKSWSDEKTATSTGSKLILSKEIVNFNGLGFAYSVSDEGDIWSNGSKSFYYVDENGKTKTLAENKTSNANPQYAMFGDNPALYWYEDGEIKYITNISEEAKSISLQNSSFDKGYQIVNGDDGEVAIVYSEANTETGNVDINTVMYNFDEEKWSEDVVAVKDGDFKTGANGFIEDGKINVVYQNVDNFMSDNSKTDICVSEIDKVKNIRVNSVVYDEEQLKDNGNLSINVDLSNIGTDKIDSVKIELINSDKVVYSENKSLNLSQGVSDEISFSYYVGEVNQIEDYTIKVYTSEEEDLSDNEQTIKVGAVNINLVATLKNLEGGDSVILSASNATNISADTIINVYENNNLINSIASGIINANETRKFVYDINTDTDKESNVYKFELINIDDNNSVISSDFVVNYNLNTKEASDDVNEDSILKGDTNLDYTLSLSDVEAIINKVLNYDNILPIEEKVDDYLKYVDMDDDGKLTATDAILILNSLNTTE